MENNVTIFSGSYSHLFSEYPKTEGLFTKEKIDDVNYIWVKTPKYKNSKSIGRIISMLVFMVNLFFFNIFNMKKPDIIIISSLSLFPVINAYIWSKIFKIEFIFEVRDIWPMTLMELGNISKFHPLVLLLSWFEKFGYKKAKYVVSVLPNAKEHMISQGMKENKFKYIPNGVNLEEVENYEEIPTSIQQNIPQNKFIVGYVGTLGIANAMQYFFEVVLKLKDNKQIHFIIVGKGGEKKNYKEYCQVNKLENVTFIEQIPKIQVQGILKYFDLCYIGWHNKNIYKYGISANKLFDYMYSATPILHSISIENDIVQDANCGIRVDAEDSEKIKEAIISMSLKKPEELKAIGQNGKTYVIEHHTYANIAKKYITLMESKND
jgi:glycosyltransferase involved in cell wall biosynthesis